MWSKHLAGGYYDHPPMVAVVIRLGTMIAGDTEFGVRLVSVLLGLPMSFAVYRTAEILFGGRRVASTATILLNATMMASVGTQIVFATPLVFTLGVMGLYAQMWRDAGALASRALINSTYWTITLYFAWHSLNSRVEANWFGPAYLAVAIAAAVAADSKRWNAR